MQIASADPNVSADASKNIIFLAGDTNYDPAILVTANGVRIGSGKPPSYKDRPSWTFGFGAKRVRRPALRARLPGQPALRPDPRARHRRLRIRRLIQAVQRPDPRIQLPVRIRIQIRIRNQIQTRIQTPHRWRDRLRPVREGNPLMYNPMVV